MPTAFSLSLADLPACLRSFCSRHWVTGTGGSNRRQPLPRKVFTPTKIAVYLLENKALFPRLISSFVVALKEPCVTRNAEPLPGRRTRHAEFLGLGVLAPVRAGERCSMMPAAIFSTRRA